jgi:hypothetical protein
MPDGSNNKYPPYERKLPHYSQDQLRSFTGDDKRIHYYMPDSYRRVCGRLKRAHNRAIPNEACLAPPMANGSCRIHGGKSGRPIQSGRYSKRLKKWRREYFQALWDKDLLDPRPDLAMMDVAVGKLVERFEKADCPGWRAEARKTFSDLQSAIRANKRAEVGKLMKRMEDLLEKGAAEDQAIRDLMEYIDKRANRALRVVEVDVRREERVTATELASMFAVMIQTLEQKLEPKTFYAVLPALRQTAMQRYLPPIGSATETAAKDSLHIPMPSGKEGPAMNGHEDPPEE